MTSSPSTDICDKFRKNFSKALKFEMVETKNNHTQHFSGKEIGLKLLVDSV
jgi:hypothetical protein